MASTSVKAQGNLVSFICDSCLLRSSLSRASQLRRIRKTPAASFTTSPRSPPLNAYSRRTVLNSGSQTQPVTLDGSPNYRTYSNHRPPSIESPSPKGFVHLTHRRLIWLAGPDAPKFLQGLVTNNIHPDHTEPLYSAFLDARGRVLWDIFIWRMKAEKWACYIEVDGDEVDNVMRHLKRHKLRSKIELRAVDDHELALWAAWGVEEAELPNYHLVDPRAEGFGYRMLLQGTPQVGDVPMLDAEQYRVRRYMFGIPEGQREIAKEAALPMECNIDLSSGIDFRKGCYVGQELTIRTKHTGVVRKRILPVQLYRAGESIADADGQPAYNPDWRGEAAQGADVKQLDAEGSIKKGRSAGKFIAGVGNVGLALCRLEMMTPMRVSAEGGAYDPEVEFALQSSGTETEVPVRVKAFIPPWLLSRDKELWSKGRKGSVE